MLARVLMSVGASDSVASAISDKVLAITTNSPTDATVGFRLLSDGTLQVKEGGAYTSVAGEWANPRGSVGHLFNACLSRVAGDVTSGPTGFVPMTQNRTWELTQTEPGFKTYVGQLKIQRGTVINTATIQMAVQVVGSNININNKTLSAFTFRPSVASAAIRLLSDGTLMTRASHSNAPFGAVSNEWANPKQNLLGTQYEARLTKTSGTTPSGSLLGAWLSLGSTLTWDLQSASRADFTGTLEIRQGTNVIDSAAINLNAHTEDVGL